MSSEQYSRTEMLTGHEATETLARSGVLIFGVGGVGCGVVEGLARAGIGRFELVDSDIFEETNLNRQLFASYDTLGRYKVDVAAERIKSLNDRAEVTVRKLFITDDNAETFDFGSFDYVIDAVDTAAAKVWIVTEAIKAGVPVISSMGCGNRFDPTKLEITDLFKTYGDPLAKMMRQEMKKRGIRHLKVLFSCEPPAVPRRSDDRPAGRHAPGSTPFVPTAAGLAIASEAVRDLIAGEKF